MTPGWPQNTFQKFFWNGNYTHKVQSPYKSLTNNMTLDDTWMTSDDPENTLKTIAFIWLLHPHQTSPRVKYDLRWPLDDCRWRPWKYLQSNCFYTVYGCYTKQVHKLTLDNPWMTADDPENNFKNMPVNGNVNYSHKVRIHTKAYTNTTSDDPWMTQCDL